MPLFLSLASLMNGIVWVIYACLKFDPYILIPNGLGSISGIVQQLYYTQLTIKQRTVTMKMMIKKRATQMLK
ncbi:unnamed protein product [Brassica napus]|uniref:(rape) hypothetical protein n=1 Tax=Brassica napus TaxID=3708 RepID=A0A816SN53_BRANA|nr:unnamed protein product [Brassica napus]